MTLRAAPESWLAPPFDAAIMQFGLMFVPDRTRALAEMGRVVANDGAVVVVVWAEIESNPGYRALAALFDMDAWSFPTLP